MDINTPHNSTSFNNKSLEESDNHLSKNVTDKSEKCLLRYKPNINSRDGLSESQSFNNDYIISTGNPASHNKNSEYYTYKRTASTDDHTFLILPLIKILPLVIIFKMSFLLMVPLTIMIGLLRI